LADLAELYIHRSKKSGVNAARLWYWSLVLSFPTRLLLDLGSLRPSKPLYATNPIGPTSRSAGATMSSFFQDARYALRGFRRTPGFLVVAVVTLALGIGFTTAMFSVVNGILLRPLPFAEPDRLVKVFEIDSDGESDNHSGANYIDFKTQNTSFSGVAGHAGANNTVTGREAPTLVRGASVTSNFFSVLGAKALLGRTLSPEIDIPGAQRTVVLSHSMWQSHFGGDVAAIGEQLEMNNEVFVVVGIMPPGFEYPGETKFWAASKFEVPEPPVAIVDDPASVRTLSWFDVFGRLKDGVTNEQAQAELDVFAGRVTDQSVDSETQRGFLIKPLRETIVGDVSASLYVLLGAVGLLLLIACGNVANLMLVRASTREKELVVRGALGAGQSRIIRQLVTESLVLALVGGALGIPIALWGTHLLLAMAPEGIPRVDQVGVDLRVLSFALAVSLGTGVLFGLAPAAQSLGSNLRASTVVGGSRQTFSKAQSRLRGGLIVGEVALSLLLLVGAGLLMRTFLTLNSVDPGFDSLKTLSARVWIPDTRYQEDEEVGAFYRETLERVRAIPGVRSAGAVLSLPINYGISGRFGFSIEGYTPPEEDNGPIAGYQVASAGYFETLGIPVIRGRDFTELDDAEAPSVALINQALAELYWAGEDPIGRRITFDDPEGEDVDWATIVGVVGNTRHSGLDEPPRPELFVAYQQSPITYMTLVVQSEMEVAALTGAVRRAVMEVDPQQPLSEVLTMEQVLFESLGSQRFNLFLLGAFAVAAIVLAAVGLYGVLSFSVTQRSNEIGIRMALGARAGGVVGNVVRQGFWLALLGLAIGTAAAIGLTRLMASMIHGVSATDPLTFIAGIVLLTAIALVASWVPALRAARVSPMEVLRVE
jgi:putative ABC transport system permease protein